MLIVKMTRLKLRTLCKGKGKALKEMIVVIVTAGSGQWKRNRGRVETCHRPGGRESALLPMSSQREDLQLEGQGFGKAGVGPTLELWVRSPHCAIISNLS